MPTLYDTLDNTKAPVVGHGLPGIPERRYTISPIEMAGTSHVATVAHVKTEQVSASAESVVKETEEKPVQDVSPFGWAAYVVPGAIGLGLIFWSFKR